ncbi:MAG: hypothetical protein V4736_08810 [Bdellovibrionota bacterium]
MKNLNVTRIGVQRILTSTLFTVVLTAGMSSCTRPVEDLKAKSKITFQLPSSNSSLSNVGALVANPTSLSDINCYMVGVGGPEEPMQRNQCELKASGNTIAGLKIGAWGGGYAAGSVVSLDVPSGSSRTIHLIGFKSDVGGCTDFRTGMNDSLISSPYYLGKVEGVNMSAGATVTVPITRVFDPTLTIGECQGPDMGGVGGGNSVATKIKVEKDFFPFGTFRAVSCESMNVKLVDNFDQEGVSPSGDISFSVELNGSPVTLYQNSNDCSMTSNGSVSADFTAGERWKSLYFTTPSTGIMSFSLAPNILSGPALTEVLKMFNNRDSNGATFDWIGPRYIVPGICYAYKIEKRYYNNNLIDNPFQVAVSGDGSYVYSDSNCSSTANIGNLTATQASGDPYHAWVYVKTTSADSSLALTGTHVSGTITADTSRRELKVGSGTATPVTYEFNLQDQFQINNCGPIDFEVQNERHYPVRVPPGGYNVTLNNPSDGLGSYGQYYADPSCSINIGNSFTVFGGTTGRRVFIKPTRVGAFNVSASAAGLSGSPRPFSVYQPYKLNLNPMEGVGPFNNGECTVVDLQHLYVNGGSSAQTPNELVVNIAASATNHFALYAAKSGSTCLGPQIPNVKLNANTSNINVYIQVKNAGLSQIWRNLKMEAATYTAASLDLSIAAAPAIDAADMLSYVKVAREYPFDLNFLIQPYSGIAPFNFTKTYGTGTWASPLYTPSATSADFTIADSVANNFPITLLPVSQATSIDFTEAALPSGFSFTGPANAYYVNAAGLLVATAASSDRRIDHDPTPGSGHPKRGLLLETVAYNKAPHNLTFVSEWSTNFLSTSSDATVAAPTGINGVKVFSSTASVGQIAYAAPSTGASVSNSGEGWGGSVFVKKKTARYAALAIYEGGSQNGYAGVVIDLDNGVVVPMKDSNIPDPAATVGVEKYINGWFRIWTTYRAKNSTGGITTLKLFPAYRSNASSLSGVSQMAVTGDTYFWGPQLETGYGNSGSVTSLIESSSGPFTPRDPDTLYSTDISTTALAAVNTANFTAQMKVYFPERTFPGTDYVFFSLCDPANNCSPDHIKIKTSNSLPITLINDLWTGGPFASISLFPQPIRGGINRISFGVESGNTNSLSIALNGQASGTASMSISVNGLSNGYLSFAENNGGFNGHLQTLEFWNQKFENPSMRSLTRP